MSRVQTATDGTGEEAESRVLRCSECGQFCSARTTADGEVMPFLGTSDSRCPGCGGDEFEQAVLAPERD